MSDKWREALVNYMHLVVCCEGVHHLDERDPGLTPLTREEAQAVIKEAVNRADIFMSKP